MPPVIDHSKCTGCGICWNVCPEDVFARSGSKAIPTVPRPDECWHCDACVIDCPEECIELYIPLTMRI